MNVPRVLLFLSLLLSGTLAAADPAAVYVITDPGETLGSIALRHYGRFSKWEDLARWNGLEPPYVLSLGQRIRLNEPPRRSASEGERLMVEMWRKRLDGRSQLADTSAAEDAVQELTASPRVEFRTEAFQEARKALEARATHSEAEGESPEKTYLSKGEELMGLARYIEAAEQFRLSREFDPQLVRAWVLEIRALKLAGEAERQSEVSRKFLDAHPVFRNLPMFSSLSDRAE